MPTITGVATSITAFAGRARSGPVHVPTPIRSWGEFGTIFGGLWPASPMSYAVRQFFDNGGREAIVVRVSAGIASPELSPGTPDGGPVGDAEILGDRAAGTGVSAFDEAEFNLLCVPPPDWDRDLSLATWATCAEFCATRRAMLLVDAPAAWSSVPTAEAARTSMSELVAGLGDHAGNAAVYFPRLRAGDPLAGNALRDVAPCGAVAGVYDRTDITRGVWSAPAGAEARLVGVVGPVLDLPEVEVARLNMVGLNCLRSVPRAGTVVWGARAASAATAESEWKYVPVRRLSLFLERSIDRGTQWVVFEPNAERLWTQVRNDVEQFLLDLFRLGAFAGSTPREAYFVKCDQTTMTQDDIDNGRLIIVVGIAPSAPAEFVLFRIGKMTAEAKG